MTYLDAAATTPVRREVLEAMWPYLTSSFGNPSSHHEIGEAARRGLDAARADVAAWLGARPGELVFTSGGTEANNLAIKGITWASTRGRHVVVSAVEHAAVLEAADFIARTGGSVTVAPVDATGQVDPAAVAAALRDDTALVSVQHANNEVGTVQPVAAIAAVCAERGVPLHTDAVQSAGWFDLDIATLGVQALTVSGHKLGAPKGTGALYLARRVPVEPLIHGGGQENDRRSGTENVAGAVGLAAAARLPRPDAAEVAARRDRFIAAVLDQVPDARLTGHPVERLPGHASFVFPGRSGESILLDLERHGVVSSSGSACHAGSSDPSPVLLAMGVNPDDALTAVRFSFGVDLGDAELERVAEVVAAVVRA